MIDIESETLKLLEDNGFDPRKPPSGEYLACCMVGMGRVRRKYGLKRKALWCNNTDEVIFRADLSKKAEDFTIRHELGERYFSRIGYRGDDTEELCNRFAAALSCPAPALRSALIIHGRHLPSLAEHIGTTQSVIALRLGEVTGHPIALITPRHVFVRGDPWFQATAEGLRAVARQKRLPESVARMRVTDVPRRIVLQAA